MLLLAHLGLAAALAAAPPSNPELDPAPIQPGAYTYGIALQRRDPFINVLRRRGECTSCMAPKKKRAFISELALKGIVKTPAGFRAVLEDLDGKTHPAVLGDTFDDGEVIAIDARGVTFRQKVRDPLSPVKVREIRKTLHSVGASP
jgi:hypothetical protein